jgi:hypothetical protein
MSQPIADDVSVVNALQEWYLEECNGDWEHSYGVVIETLDNPGWLVKIDLEETPLACRARPKLENRVSEKDWLDIKITDAQFIGTGDPAKLLQILRTFIEFKNSAESAG